MKRKYFSKTALLCAIVLILQCFVPVSFAQENIIEEVPLKSEEISLFKALGMINEKMAYNSNSTIDRGDFAYIIARLAGYKDEPASNDNFSDVVPTMYYHGAVNFLADRGIVSGNGVAFRPEDAIIFDEAAVMAVRVLGYEEYSKIKYGSYPNNARMMGEKLDLFDYIVGEFKYTDKMSIRNAFILLENLTEAPALKDVAFVDDEIVYEKSNYTTILSINHDIYRGYDIIKDNGVTSLSGISTLGKSRIQIGDTVYKLGENAEFIRDYVGESVDFWYNNETKTVIYARRNSEETDTLEISYQDLLINSDDFTAQNIVYYDAYDKQKNATVSIAADVTYNNVAFPYYTAADFKIKNGKLVLIDMDRDKVYDTVKIIAYTDALVNAATEADKRVITSTGTYVLEDYDSYEIVDVYGNPAEFSQLTAKTPVSVVVSKDKKTYVKIIICNDYKVSGMVESQSDSDGLTWTVSGKTADASLELIEKINKKVKTAPSVGENYVMYVNADGKVFDYKKSLVSDDWYDGYVLAIGVETNNMQQKLKARILMSDRTTIDVFYAEKFKLNDVTTEIEDALKNEDLFRLKGQDRVTKRQPVRFTLNSWEEINVFETPKDIRKEGIMFDTERFSLDKHYDTVGYKAEYVKAVDEMYVVTNSSFIIKDEHLSDEVENVDERDVEFLTVNDLGSVDGFENCYLYDFNDTLNVGTMVFESFTGSTGISFDNNMTIIDKVYRVLDEDGKATYKVDCGRYGAYQSLELYDDKVDVSGLKRGDVINIRLREGKIAEYKFICNVNEPTEAKYVDCPENSFINKVHAIIYAPVFSTNSSGLVIVAPEEEIGGVKYNLIGNSYNNNNTRVVVYDVKAKTIKAGSVSSIYSNLVYDEKGNYILDETTTRVLLRRRWGYAAEAIFIIY